MATGLPNDDVLFAVYAVQLGFCTPAQVAFAGATDDPTRSLADRLELAGALNPQQRKAVQRRMEREVADGCATLNAPSPPAERNVLPTRECAPTLNLGVLPERTLAEPPSIDPGPLDEEVDDRISPAQAGRYTVCGQHAAGGQARILLAIDEHIGREIAIKELRPDVGSGEWSGDTSASQQRSTPGVVRFLREARVTGQLEHPNIVPVHEVGRREDGSYYYTMRFVRGQTLAHKLKACRTLAERMKLLGAFWDVCNAIAFAHSRGVVHRDIKPENVMAGEFGETVVLDWGVAKVAGKRDIRATDIERELRFMRGQDTGKTAAGTAIGTPSYMSPEQARGQIDEIDERSDVWGLGAVLYEILTGRPPYLGATPMDTILKVGEEPLVPVAQVCPEAPPELAAVAEQALQKDRDLRYQTAKDLTRDIDAYMTGSRVRAYEYTSWELLKRFAAQNKKTIVAVGLVLAVIVGALVAVSVSLQAETRARHSEHQALERAEAARAQEQTERRLAHFHLAQAYVEKADRMAEDLRTLSARVFAAAALVHNPAHPKSPYLDPGFAGQRPGSRDLWVSAASKIYRFQFGQEARLERAFGMGEVITRLACSPDGKRFAIGSLDQALRLWEPASGAVQRLGGHDAEIYAVAYSPDGRFLASADRKGRVLLRQAPTGEVVRRLTGARDRVNQLAFSPDSRWLAAASFDKTVRLWDVRSGRAGPLLKSPTGRVQGLAFWPDGDRLSTVGGDGRLLLWDLPRARLLKELAASQDEIYALAISPDGRLLATAGYDQIVRLWRPADDQPLHTFRGHTDAVLSLAFSPDSRLLVSTSYDKTARLWDPHRGRALLTLDGHRNFVWDAAFTPDGRSLATSGYDQTARLWSLAPGRALPEYSGHRGSIYALAFTPDGKLLASGAWDHSVRVWSLAGNRPAGAARFVLTGHTDIVDNLAASPDSTRLASVSRDGTARVWDLVRGLQLYVLRGHRDKVSGVQFSPDGDLLATSGSDKTIRIWDVASGRQVLKIEGHTEDVNNLSFSPDGRQLASVSNDKSARIWDPRTGDQLRVLRGHADWISGVDHSPDGKLLSTSGKDGTVILWDAHTGLELRRLAGHTQWVNTVVFSPDGRWLATASDDRSVRLWDVSTGQAQLAISANLEVVAVAFSPDSQSLAIGDGEITRRYPLDFSLLHADPRALLAEAERASGEKLEGFDLQVVDATH